MNIDRAIEVLRSHNEWRRCNDDESPLCMLDPREVGEAIDAAVEFIESVKAFIAEEEES